MKRILLATAATCALAASQAGAATLDFVAFAAGNEHGIASGTTLTFDGLDVTFTSNYNPYFDDISSGRPGGLGVCKILTSDAQCTPSNDDNVTVDEWVTLTFGQTVDLSGFSFNDADHFSLNSSLNTFGLTLNGGLASSTSFASAVGSTYYNVNSITFAHENIEFYVDLIEAAPVPIPASAPLLLGALGLLGFASRRRKSA